MLKPYFLVLCIAHCLSDQSAEGPRRIRGCKQLWCAHLFNRHLTFLMGLFAVGSLIARVFFQPIEESSRLFFSKALSSSSEAPTEKSRTMAINNALNTLRNIILFYTHMGLLLVSLAPPYLRLVLCAVLPGRYVKTHTFFCEH